MLPEGLEVAGQRPATVVITGGEEEAVEPAAGRLLHDAPGEV